MGVEETLNRFFRLLDAHMQAFASLHTSLDDTEKQALKCCNLPNDSNDGSSLTSPCAVRTSSTPSEQVTGAAFLLKETMREIAVVLLACDRMQHRVLEFKMDAADAIAQSGDGKLPRISFVSFAEFIEQALAFSSHV